jgi:copper chaperone
LFHVEEAAGDPMSEPLPVVLSVSGMTCDGCAKAVTRVVQKIDPRATVAVDLASGRVDIQTGVDAAALAAAISKAGYPAASA